MNASSSSRAAIAAYIRREALPVDKYGHQPRLYALTQLIGEDLDYDDDVVYAAVWLHDLGVFVGHRPENPAELPRWDNVAHALEKAPGVLAVAGFPPGKIGPVLQVIRTHQASSEPETIEATIVRDADILEQLGAVGILRAVSKVGRDTRYADFSSVVEVLQRSCSSLPAQLRLPRSREFAAARIKVLESCLDAAAAEGQPALF